MSRRQRGWGFWVGALLCSLQVIMAATACAGRAATTTAEETTVTVEVTSATIPALTPEEQAELQAQAVHRAVREHGGGVRLCISTDTPADLRAALADEFGDRLEFVQPGEQLLRPGADSQFLCTGLVVEQVQRASADTVCISAGVVWGPTSGQGAWYCYRWDGSAWIEIEQVPGFIGGWAS